MTGPVRWGILGAGRISTVAVGPALASSPACEVAAVGARDRARAGSLAAGLGAERGARAYGSYAEVIADPDVEVVYIALPNDAHVRWAVEAVRAGKHVLSEKPLGMDRAEVSAAFDAAAAAGRLVVEAAWNRWHPRTRAAEQLVADGALGTVTAVDAGFTFSGVPAGDYRLQPERGGGALYDVGCYALAAAGWATGWAPIEGALPEVRRHPGGVDLSTHGRLRVGGAAVEVRAAIDEPERQWLEITGTRGALRFGEPALTAWTDGVATLELHRPGIPPEVLTFPACDPYRLMVEAVAGRVRGGSEWVVARRDSEWVAQAIDMLRGSGPGAG